MPPSTEEFATHFRGRAHCELEPGFAFYSNEDTGVYFSFVCGKQDLGGGVWARFELNYLRPSCFAIEAAIEVDAFVAAFASCGLEICDPLEVRDREPADGPLFDARAFFAAWSAGNGAAYASKAPSLTERQPICRPERELRRIWMWNYERARIQEEVGDAVFVPRIEFYRVGDEIRTGCVWPDGLSALLPRTEEVLVYREALAPANGAPIAQPDVATVPWDDLEPVLESVPRRPDPVEHLVLDASALNTEVAEFLRGLGPQDRLESIPMDRVLDAELLS